MPCLQHFRQLLEAHICERLQLESSTPIVFKNERIFQHAVFHVNYTTYDIQRDQDTIHRSTDRVALMVSTSHDESESACFPWVYAHVLGIFHVEVLLPSKPDNDPTHVEFLWVRWMERDTTVPVGLAARRLQRVRFRPITSADAFGFIDPASALRACHLTPAFHHGRTPAPSHDSLVYKDGNPDWKYYYVMR